MVYRDEVSGLEKRETHGTRRYYASYRPSPLFVIRTKVVMGRI